MRWFSEEHEWVTIQKGVATVGITPYAAEELGDVTFVELPEVGLTVAQGESLGVVESVKAASDVFSPIGGTVVEVNLALEEEPALLNASPDGDGWICKLGEIDESELESLMGEEEYDQFVAEGDGDD